MDDRLRGGGARRHGDPPAADVPAGTRVRLPSRLRDESRRQPVPTAPPSSSRCSTRTTTRTDSDSRCKARQRTTPRTAPRDSTRRIETASRAIAYERVGPTFEAGDTSNADVLTAALGLRGSHATALAHLRNANVREQLDARHMNRALWPATWEYFFTNMIGVVFNRCRRGVGAESLRRACSRVRAAADAPCRQATLRRPPRDIAESLEIIRTDRGGPQPRSRAQGLPAEDVGPLVWAARRCSTRRPDRR